MKKVSTDNRLRVAAYCRTANVDGITHELQEKHYNELIHSNPDWKFAGIYADHGASGTNMEREQFQAMIGDAVAGKIDCIITKSLSRFARNTANLITCVRKLKEHCVRVIFETEGIDTLDSGSEAFLTVLCAMAEDESSNKGNHLPWSCPADKHKRENRREQNQS